MSDLGVAEDAAKDARESYVEGKFDESTAAAMLAVAYALIDIAYSFRGMEAANK